ncbi:MAG: dipeptidase [Candidatus Caldatribacteriota bacterium]|nr:dipeptidase [Candidatus Caldatribacteriota bacterium]
MIKKKSNLSIAKQIHQKAMVFDGHCDTILEIINHGRSLGKRNSKSHLDIPKLIEGGVNVQVFAIFIEDVYKPNGALKRTLQMFDSFYHELGKNQDKISLVTNYSQIEKANKAGKICAIISIEGGEALEGDLAVLRVLYRMGIRLITLTWNQRNQIADGVGEAQTNSGLTGFGLKVVKEMNKLGMLIDVSHLSEAGFWDVIKNSKTPIVASHSNCYALCSHPRNLKDTQIEALANKSGVIGVTFVPNFLTTEKRKTNVEDILDNIDYLVKIGGMDCVGLGSDFDGTKTLPENLSGADKIPNITSGLIKRGYKEREIKKILGENFLRVLKEVVG